MAYKRTTLLFVINVVLCFDGVYAGTVFTYREQETDKDVRYEYDRQLLELALKKTEDKYGPYELVPSKAGANERRSQIDAETGAYVNFFFKQSVKPSLIKNLAYVPFPIDRGIVGYRVAFLSTQTKEKLKTVKTLADLKKMTILQGVGWFDAEILESQGFKVVLSGYFEPMFQMVARNRADLFFRGVNEILDEWQSHKHIPNLTYDESIVIHYPMPRFFFTTKGNTEAVKRIQEGILAAYNDGSLDKLWHDYYQPSISFTNLKNRRVFELDNPLIKDLDQSYLKYNIDPFD